MTRVPSSGKKKLVPSCVYDYILVYRILWQRRSCTTSLRSIGGAGPTWRSCRLLTRCPKLTDPWTSYYAQFSLTRISARQKIKRNWHLLGASHKMPKTHWSCAIWNYAQFSLPGISARQKIKKELALIVPGYCAELIAKNLAISKSGKGSFWNSESESEHELYRFPTEKRIVGLLFHHCIPFTVLFSIYIQD